MKIDNKERVSVEMSESITKQQEQVTQRRYEIEQHKLALSNFRSDHNYKVEQFRNKIADMKEML